MAKTHGRRRTAGAFLGSFFLTMVAQADGPGTGSQPGPGWLEEVVVTATRYEETLRTVPANVSVITAAEIARSSAKDVPGVLSQEVGLHVYDITGNRRSYRVDRSGFGETAALNTLVLVDGRRLNDPDLSGADWMLIPLRRVERIEIIRGSRGSVLYGDNATDGVINIITKGGQGRFAASVQGAAGSYDRFSTDGSVSGSHQDLSYAVTASFHQTDGYRDNGDIDSRDLGLNLDYFFGEAVTLGVSAGYHDDDTGLPGALRLSALESGIDRRDTLNPRDFVDTEDYYVQLNPEVDIWERGYLKLPVSYRRRDQVFFASFVGGEFQGDTEITYGNASPQFVMKEPAGTLENNLTLGADLNYADEAITNRSLFFGDLDIRRFDLKRRNYGLYVYDEIYPVDSLAVSAGYRYDKVKYEFSPTPSGAADDRDFDENLFTAGVTYRFHEDSYVYVSYAQGFRYPVLDEVFNFFTNTVNRDLRPQTSDDYEVGIRYRFAASGYANVNLFRLNTRDEIFFNPASFANENLDAETRRHGVEVSVGIEREPVTLRGSYTYRDSETRGGAYSGNQVPNVPRHQATLDVTWRPLRRFSIAVSASYVGERLLESDFENRYAKQEAYTLVNLKLEYRWQALTGFLDVNNLFDEDYAAYGVLSTFPVEPAFYPSPERHFLAGIRYDY